MRLTHEDILRLNVAMDDLKLVEVMDTVSDLKESVLRVVESAKRF